jgi:hypothetical protein
MSTPAPTLDCRTCTYNSYKNLDAGWVFCSHPVTLQKTPKWEKGDPAWVNAMTSDRPISQIGELADCPTFEADR